jgi:penicillin-binding protein 1C
MALDTGFSPNEIIPDLPTVFGSREAYVPSNFNNRFNGPVRLRIALASSLNSPAVYVLERLGVRTFEEYLVSLGFDSIRETMGTHGTGLALGNAEVSLEEMVRAFSVFPRMGLPVELRWTEDAKLVQTAKGQATPSAMSPYAAWMIADILSDRSSRFVGFGPAPTLATPFESMFKTGTANQFQHIWALGATKRFTVGVWMGNFSGETVIGSTGSSIPARIAAKLLGALEESAGQEKGQRSTSKVTENLAGPVPQGTTEVQICALSGMAAGPYCTGFTKEFIRNERIPAVCNWHTQAGLLYPSEYRSWLSERFRLGSVRQEGAGRIRTPVSGAVFYLDPSLPANAQALRIETTGFSESALLFVDGDLAGSLNHAGVYALPLLRGHHSITVTDNEGSTASADFEVR